MKNTWNKVAALSLLGGTLLFASCDKNDTGSLEGPVTPASFTTSYSTKGLETEVTFTATPSPDAFAYSWDFGDGTSAKGMTVKHIYKTAGTYKAQLITASPGGTGFSEKKEVTVASAADLVKAILTGTSSKTWKLTPEEKAITVGTPDDPTKYYGGGAANSLPACQGDDEFTFSTTNVFTYDAKAETLVSGGVGCSAPRSGTSTFTFGPSQARGLASFVLNKTATFAPFIAVTDAPSTTYQVLAITATTMKLQVDAADGSLAFVLNLVAKP